MDRETSSLKQHLNKEEKNQCIPHLYVHIHPISEPYFSSTSQKFQMEEEYPWIPMERAGKIMRRSIYTFLQNYQYFSITAALLALPFSVSVLLSQALVPSLPLLPAIHNRFLSLFDSAGFPPPSELFTFLGLKISQTIASSILVFPFTLSTFLIAKAFVIQALSSHRKSSVQHPFSYFVSLYNHLLHTQICNSIIILSANATCFATLFVAFNFAQGFGISSLNFLQVLSATGAFFYSIVLANSVIICNMALVISGMEKCGGFFAVLKASILIRGRTATAVSLTLLVNLALAAVESLFQYRVVRAYNNAGEILNSSVALEGMFIAYLYSILIVLDTVIGCVFYQSCKTAFSTDQEAKLSYLIEIEEGNTSTFTKGKTFEELP